MNNQFTNFGSATISTAVVNPTDLTLALTTGQGSLFPSPTGAQYFYIVITDSLTAPTKNEIVKVTNRTGDTITMTRALDGTIAQAWVAGNYFSLRWCNASIQDVLNSQSVVLDSTFRVQAVADTTKQFGFNLTGITTANTRLWTVPDFSDTFVGVNATQTLSNKTFVAPVLGVATATSVSATTFTGALVGNATTATTAGSVATNANLTGPITSVGNATAIASQTGTGSTFVMNTSPSLITPNIGAASGLSLSLLGNISSPAWLTGGLRIKGVPATFTDTTSSGTVVAAYTDVLGGNTITATSVTTFTNYITAFFNEPVQGPNVTFTNKWALGGASLRIGTSNPFTVTNSGVVNASTLAVSGATGVGSGSGTGASAVPGLYFTGDTTTGFKYRGTSVDTISAGLTIASSYSGGYVISNSAFFGISSGYTDLTAADTLLTRDGAGIFAQKNGVNAQEYRVYGTTTGPKYLSLKHDGTNAIVGTNSGAVLFQTSATTYGQLSSAGVWSLGGAVGAESIRVTPIASAVNYIDCWGGTTGNGPQFRSTGSDPSINMSFVSKGTGAYLFYTGGSGIQQFQISDTPSAVNLHQFTGSATGNAISWAAAGSDPNISIRVATKGTGAFLINTNLSLNYNGTNAIVAPLSGQLAFGTAALATTATTGFHCTVSGAGAPTGVPASIPTGQIPTYYDSTNNRIYFYNGAWRSVAVA